MFEYFVLLCVGLLWCMLLLGALFFLREGYRLVSGKRSKHFEPSKWVGVEREIPFSKHLGLTIIACGVYLFSVCAAIVVFQLPLKAWNALLILMVPIAYLCRYWLDRKAKE